MTLPQVLGVLILADTLGSVLSCGGGPTQPPCSWTECRHEWRDDWFPGIPPGRCVSQHRKSHHVYETHNASIVCPPPTQCMPRAAQYRTMCSCKNVYHCPYHAWSAWSGSIAQGSCGKQSRYRDFNEQVRYDVKEYPCNGIQSCGSREYNYRTFCSCKYGQCNPGSWSTWATVATPSNPNCAHRTRSYSLTWLYTYRQDNCTGVSPQAPACQPDDVEKRNCNKEPIRAWRRK